MRTVCFSVLLLASVVSRKGLSAEGTAAPSSGKLVSMAAGDLVVTLDVAEKGIRIERVHDKASNTPLGSNSPLPLFSIKLRTQGSESDTVVGADDGWTSVKVSQDLDGDWTLEWSGYEREELSGLAVRAEVHPDSQADALHWSMHVDLPSKTWCVRSVVFPQLAIPRFGSDAEVLYPRAPGEVNRDVWERPFTYTGTYPSGWTSMQMMAVYDSKLHTGLYRRPARSSRGYEVSERHESASSGFRGLWHTSIPHRRWTNPATDSRCKVTRFGRFCAAIGTTQLNGTGSGCWTARNGRQRWARMAVRILHNGCENCRCGRWSAERRKRSFRRSRPLPTSLTCRLASIGITGMRYRLTTTTRTTSPPNLGLRKLSLVYSSEISMSCRTSTADCGTRMIAEQKTCISPRSLCPGRPRMRPVNRMWRRMAAKRQMVVQSHWRSCVRPPTYGATKWRKSWGG